MNSFWIYPFIIVGGALQTCGAAMNAQLFQSLENKWLASAVSFALITAFFLCIFEFGFKLYARLIIIRLL